MNHQLIPGTITRLEERIFMRLSLKEQKKFRQKFNKEVLTNTDLSLVWPKFAVFILEDTKHGVLQYAQSDKLIEVITNVIELYQKIVNSGGMSLKVLEITAGNAENAATTPYPITTTALAASTAYAVICADTAMAADYAAEAYASAHDTDGKAHYSVMAKKLIQILKD